MKAEHETNRDSVPQSGAEGPALIAPGKQKAYRKPTERLKAAALLIDSGMTPRQVAEQLGYKNARGMQERIKGKGLAEFATKKRVQSASKVIDCFLDGRTFGEIEKVKDSTVLAAASMVLDRAYPKAAPEGSAPVSFTTVNLTLVQAPSVQDTVDITPPVTFES